MLYLYAITINLLTALVYLYSITSCIYKLVDGQETSITMPDPGNLNTNNYHGNSK